MNPVLSIGIDPSLSATAVCRMHSPTEFHMNVFGSEPLWSKAPVTARLNRYQGLSGSIVNCIAADFAPVCLEGYGASARGNSQVPMIEFGCTLRTKLVSKWSVSEIPPASVKKFAAGKGNADKMKVALAVQKRWGVTFDSSDEFDAYVLAVIGLCLSGNIEPDTQWQREVIETLNNGGVKKKRKANKTEATR